MKLINRKYLAMYGPWPKNYNYDEIEQYEDVSISIWIKPLIGQYLLEQLEYEIKNNSLSDENATLLVDGGLWRYLCYAMAYESLPMAAYKITEVGLVKSDSDNSKSVDTKEYGIVEQHLRRTVEVLKEQVQNFLCSHCNQFPLFDPSVCGCGCPCNNDKAPVKPNANWLLYSTPKKDTDLK